MVLVGLAEIFKDGDCMTDIAVDYSWRCCTLRAKVGDWRLSSQRAPRAARRGWPFARVEEKVSSNHMLHLTRCFCMTVSTVLRRLRTDVGCAHPRWLCWRIVRRQRRLIWRLMPAGP